MRVATKQISTPLSKEEILDYLKELKPQLAKDGIVELGLFGSYANGYADEFSDIDIVIEMSEEIYSKMSGLDYFACKSNMRKKLENHFNVDIDIVNAKYIKKNKATFLRGVVYV